ncbi:MAG: TetR/AcrR family transcriptional regulator [Oscillospiraceae bacterium]|nr:TetR/AcrR family transcriptional regulator [Oscillospiraceae bacterium]
MDKRTQKTRQAIRNAYITLLLDRHAPRLTVTAIAREANIDRKTFYLHYDTVEDVERDYNRQLTLELLGYLDEEGFFAGNPDAGCFFRSCNRLIGAHLALFQHTVFQSRLSDAWEEATAELTGLIADRYADSVTVRRDVLCIYIRFLLAGSHAIYRDWIRGQLKFDIEELGRIATDAAFEGFSAIME